MKKVDEFADAISDAARSLLSHVTNSSASSTSSLIMCGKRTSLDLGLNPEIIKKVSKSIDIILMYNALNIETFTYYEQT